MTKEENIKNLKQIKKVGLCKKYLDSIDEAIKALEQSTSDDCVSRQAVRDAIMKCETMNEDSADGFIESTTELEAEIACLPPVTPTHGTCKDCKHWKDSDGVYRRGIGAESKCPINNSKVREGTFYCRDFKK